MRIVGFIEREQSDVIEKILRHCGLWRETPTRAPPEDFHPQIVEEPALNYGFFKREIC